MNLKKKYLFDAILMTKNMHIYSLQIFIVFSPAKLSDVDVAAKNV